MDQIPTLQALVLADQIYVDTRTGKKVIAGTFSCLWAREFPTKYHAPTWAFVCLTNVQGDCTLTLRYVDLATNSVLLEGAPACITSEDRLATQELVIEVPTFPMPHAGVYAFEVYAGDNLLGSLRIMVKQAHEAGQT